MTDREMLEKLLVEMSELKDGQRSLEAGQRSLEAGQRSLEAGQRSLEDGQRSLEDGQRSLEGGQRSLEDGQQVLTDRMQGFEDRVQLELESLKTDVRHTRVLVESDVTKKIQIVAEQHGDIVEKLDVLNDYPETRSRVATLEHVVKAHTQDIGKLKKAVG